METFANSQAYRDRYFLNKFGIYECEYKKAFDWACSNWWNMIPKAQGKDAVSIADQITRACRVSYAVGADIAQCISFSKGAI